MDGEDDDGQQTIRVTFYAPRASIRQVRTSSLSGQHSTRRGRPVDALASSALGELRCVYLHMSAVECLGLRPRSLGI